MQGAAKSIECAVDGRTNTSRYVACALIGVHSLLSVGRIAMTRRALRNASCWLVRKTWG
jgi:hypothetical protein